MQSINKTSDTRITEEVVAQALMTQAATKAPGPDKINFKILQMIWSWDKARITSMVYHAIRLGYHPKEWKKARGILLEKGGKRDFGLVRSYRVISLLKCMGKVVEKVVAKELSQYCEYYSKLHPGQMGGRKRDRLLTQLRCWSMQYKKSGSKKS